MVGGGGAARKACAVVYVRREGGRVGRDDEGGRQVQGSLMVPLLPAVASAKGGDAKYPSTTQFCLRGRKTKQPSTLTCAPHAFCLDS